ncbi:hypothetical protein AAHA92_22976 [Salvia divinorum]|uniref:F-box/kelch-repeat protein n=1 Tax=Salvia divinorum TaxID=28513 RepID=A0ABD1GQF6_SALDI
MEGETSWAHSLLTLDLILPDDLLERIIAYLPGWLCVSDKLVGHAYDPVLRKWCSIDLSCIEKSNWFVASSCGLVCFMDNDSRSELYVCILQ